MPAIDKILGSTRRSGMPEPGEQVDVQIGNSGDEGYRTQQFSPTAGFFERKAALRGEDFVPVLLRDDVSANDPFAKVAKKITNVFWPVIGAPLSGVQAGKTLALEAQKEALNTIHKVIPELEEFLKGAEGFRKEVGEFFLKSLREARETYNDPEIKKRTRLIDEVRFENKKEDE